MIIFVMHVKYITVGGHVMVNIVKTRVSVDKASFVCQMYNI